MRAVNSGSGGSSRVAPAVRRLRSALLRWAHPGAERRQLIPQRGDEDATEKALHALGYAQ